MVINDTADLNQTWISFAVVENSVYDIIFVAFQTMRFSMSGQQFLTTAFFSLWLWTPSKSYLPLVKLLEMRWTTMHVMYVCLHFMNPCLRDISSHNKYKAFSQLHLSGRVDTLCVASSVAVPLS
jgi:hypothetical protein